MTVELAPPSTPHAEDPPPWRVLADGRRGMERRVAPSLARAMSLFALASAFALISVVTLGVVSSGRAAEREALRDARDTADLLANAVVQPALRDGLLTGDPAAIRSLDQVVRSQVLLGPRVRIKLWSPDGVIVYSDEARLVGARYPMQPEEREAMTHGRTVAELSELSGPENRFERPQGKLLEVYRPILTPNGTPLLFETYSRYALVDARRADVLRTFAPITIGTLVLLQLCQLPLVWAIVRRLRAHQHERERLLRQAIEASAAERRRIAGNVHDNVVQGLAGASFVMAGAVDAVRRQGLTAVAEDLDEASAGIRHSIGGLRSMLVEIYPPSVSVAGLGTALQDLIAPLRAQGMDATADTPTALDVPPGAEALIFRVAQEALRNVAEHSGAHTVRLSLRLEVPLLVLQIEDDGSGFDVDQALNRRDGHFGVQVLRDLAADAGAVLQMASSPGSGTRVRLEVSVA
jgi:signal transduction histidine kinase